ncbi:hypothetical protein VNO78_27679 [Psophocarpus tetragonolobus]|uniref:Uncharacterized protein n=1 Tax=Psophocarpus tetragonolobus TaxID=3891 RepID=A0AAN9S3Q5_PSOTE
MLVVGYREHNFVLSQACCYLNYYMIFCVTFFFCRSFDLDSGIWNIVYFCHGIHQIRQVWHVYHAFVPLLPHHPHPYGNIYISVAFSLELHRHLQRVGIFIEVWHSVKNFNNCLQLHPAMLSMYL